MGKNESIKHQAEERAPQADDVRFRGLFDHMAEGLALCRMIFKRGIPQDFVYLSVNPAFETLTGLRDVVGKKISEIIPGILVSDPQTIATYGRVALTGKPEKFEVFLKALGMWFSISAYSPEKGLFVAVFDAITERKQAEADLRRSIERLALAQRSSGSAVWDWDMTTEVLNWTPEMFHLFGVDPEADKASFDTWRKTIHPDDVEVAAERVAAAIRDHHRLENDYRIVLPSGQERWIHALGDTTYDPAGRPLRMTGICIDITHLRLSQLEAERVAREWQTTFDASEDAIWILDRDHRVLRSNKAAEHFFNRPLDAICGQHCWTVAHGSSAPHPDCPFERMCRSGCRE